MKLEKQVAKMEKEKPTEVRTEKEKELHSAGKQT